MNKTHYHANRTITSNLKESLDFYAFAGFLEERIA